MKKYLFVLFFILIGCSTKNRTVVDLKLDEQCFLVDIKLEDYMTVPFIIDTGASDCTMPPYIAFALYQAGKLTEEDVVGEKSYKLADGSVITTKVVKLNQIQIGDIILFDVYFSIGTSSNSPFLLGQNVLSKLENIEFDYNKNLIIIK